MSAKLVTDVDQRRLRTTKFPDEFNTKVDMRKVNIDVIKKWAKDEIEKILNAEDDVVVDLVNNLIEGERYPNIKQLQISLGGFLDKDAPRFCLELWKLCISAQANSAGIPKELLEAKKMELIQEKIKEEQVREAARKRQEEERERDRELARIRERNRDDRHRGRGGRGGRYDRDRSSPRRDSRSPPPRHRRDGDDFYRAPRATDSYVPTRRGRSSSSSRSRSPPPRRKRRNSSSSRSRSPAPRRRRRAHSRDRRDDHRRRSRSARRRRDDSRSPPPKRTRRPSPSISRSPPPRRKRRLSPSRSRSPQPYLKKRASTDLMAVNGRARRDELRLSREPTSLESTPRDERPRQRNTSSMSSDRRSTNGGAAEHCGYSFLNPGRVLPLPLSSSSPPKVTLPSTGSRAGVAGTMGPPAQPSRPAAPSNRPRINKDVLREKLLRERLLAAKKKKKSGVALQRKDSLTDEGK